MQDFKSRTIKLVVAWWKFYIQTEAGWREYHARAITSIRLPKEEINLANDKLIKKNEQKI